MSETLALFSDLHCHNHEAFAEPLPGGINSRGLVCLHVLDDILRIAIDSGSKHIGFVGDFWDVRGHLSSALFIKAYEILSSRADRISIYMIPGQHDLATEEKNAPSSIDVFGTIPNVHILTPDMPMSIGKVQLVGCGANTDPFKANVKSKREKILLLHLIISQISLNKKHVVETGEVAKEDLVSFMKENRIRKCFVGDVHLRQNLTKNIHYIWNCVAKDFGDVGEKKGMTFLDLDTWKTTFVPIEAPRFLEVDSPDKARDPMHYYRVYASTREQYREWNRIKKRNVRIIFTGQGATTTKKRSSIVVSTNISKMIDKYVNRMVPKKKEKKRARLKRVGKKFLK